MQPQVFPECCSSSVVPGARLAAVVVSAESVLAISHTLYLQRQITPTAPFEPLAEEIEHD